MLHALIMAGGSGTRFWPVSREARPKQLLSLLSEQSLLQTTLARLAGLVANDRVIVATSAALAESVAEQLPELPAAAILAEPCKRDTAPCIGLAAMLIARDDPQATMIVLPSDHVIRDTEAFQAGVRQALALVDEQPERLVTFGITPTYPAESFGYLERGAALGPSQAAKAGSAAAFRVVRFREKPKAEVAREYVASGNFYWNSGIFVWRASAILSALAERQPEMYQRLARVADAHSAALGETAHFDAVFAEEFAAVRGISIDFAVMEHAPLVVMIEAPFDWDDLGSWQALARQRGEDADGNTIAARHLGVNTRGTIVYDADRPARHLIVTVGVDDLIVVHTPDATLVARKSDEESLREVVKQLKQQGANDSL